MSRNEWDGLPASTSNVVCPDHLQVVSFSSKTNWQPWSILGSLLVRILRSMKLREIPAFSTGWARPHGHNFEELAIRRYRNQIIDPVKPSVGYIPHVYSHCTRFISRVTPEVAPNGSCFITAASTDKTSSNKSWIKAWISVTLIIGPH